MKPALPPKLRSNSTKFFPSPPESPLTPNDPHNQSFSSSLTLPSTPNNYYMDEMKTPTEVVKTPLLSSNESEMPCNNDIMNVNNDEVILRKKPAETVSDIICMRIIFYDILFFKASLNLIEEMEISGYLNLKKEEEDGPDIRGGHVDALIVHATKVQKVTEGEICGKIHFQQILTIFIFSAFGEAFLATYRTFIDPYNLVEKLTHRYSFFNKHINDHKQKAAKETFSLLVRVTNDLT